MARPITRHCTLIRVALLRHSVAAIRAVAAGVTFCVRSRCTSTALTLRCRITSLSDAISSCNCRLMGIEGFSRHKPVVVRTTPSALSVPTRSGAGSQV
jgi:hypothetical protein